MANFMIEMPHSDQQCLAALDQLAEQSTELLNNTWWSCMAGKHDGWAMVQAADRSEVRNMVPVALRDQVTITEVNKFTPDQIQQMHRMAA